MLPQACLQNPLIPQAGVQTVESSEKWRAERKETREIQPRTIQFFRFLQGSILALFSYYSSICAVPPIYLNAWNKLLIGHTL